VRCARAGAQGEPRRAAGAARFQPRAMRTLARLRRHELVYHGAIVFGGLVIANVFNYLYFMAAGRVLGVEPYGELTSISAAVLALSAPAGVAQTVLARLSAEFEATGSAGALARIARVAVRWSALAAAGAVLAAVAFLGPLTAFFHASSPQPVLIGALALAVYSVTTVQRGILQGTHRFGPLAWSYFAETGVRVAVGIPLAVRGGVAGALLGLLAGVTASTLYNAAVMRAPAKPSAEPAAPLPSVRRIVANVGLLQLMLTILYSSYDVALVRHLLDPRSAGLYAAASLAGRAVIGLLAFIPILVMPKATAAASRGAPVLPLLAAGLGAGIAIAGSAALVTAAASGTVVTLLAGSAFRDAGSIAALYVPAAGFLGIGGIAAAYQMGLHRYAFVPPAVLVAVAQIAAIAAWHPSAGAVAAVVLAGNAAFCAATFIGIGTTVRPG
jgi:O-antigen/teichoic acid export membrane protein